MADELLKKPFRRRSDQPRLSREEAERQGRASTLAFMALKDSGKAVAFLNGHDDALGGRPIDLAVASPEGLRAVEAAIAGLASA